MGAPRKRLPPGLVPEISCEAGIRRRGAVEAVAIVRHMGIMSETANQHPLFPPQPPSGETADRQPQAPPSHGPAPKHPPPKEIGGPKGPEPTRYGDWEVGGRCTDF
jgi:hypothetical protein